MTVVWIECDDDSILRRFTPEIVLSSKNLNSSSKVANWIIVDILINLMLSLASILLKMAIAKDHYLSAILYFLSFNLRIAYCSN